MPHPIDSTDARMYAALARLSLLFERERAAQRAVVLATVVRTAGSTYAKAGTPMLMQVRPH